MHPAIVARRHRLHHEADKAAGGFVPCADRTSTTLRVLLAARLDGGLDGHHAAELAMRAAFGESATVVMLVSVTR